MFPSRLSPETCPNPLELVSSFFGVVVVLAPFYGLPLLVAVLLWERSARKSHPGVNRLVRDSKLLADAALAACALGAEDAGKLRKLLGLLESPDELRTALSESSEAGESDLHIKIGSDESGLEDVALVTAKVQIPGGQTASISLVGPKRMDYDKAMGLLSYVSERLDEYFAGKKGENK